MITHYISEIDTQSVNDPIIWIYTFEAGFGDADFFIAPVF